MTTLHDQIAVAKQRLPLPELLRHLNLGGHARKSARCPLHEDGNASFSAWQGAHGWRWKCHAGCGEGDEIDFLEILHGGGTADAIRRFLDMAGVSTPSAATHRTATSQATRALPSRASGATPRPALELPHDSGPGTERDWRALAALRGLWWAAAGKASQLETLRFGTVCGSRCWIITDQRGLCAEARRMDGKPFAAIGELGERKAHTLKGSVKSWPVGLAVHGLAPTDFRAILAVEGGPDYLAALHFTLRDKSDCLPIAFLGAGAGSTIHPEALAALRGLRARFYPHNDNAGTRAVDKWADQLRPRASVDAFSFAGLRKVDGAPVKDLNDCCAIHPDSAQALEGLVP